MTCGIHITRTDPCVHCARAAKYTHAEIDEHFANVHHMRRGLTTGDVQRMRELQAAGVSHAAIAEQLGRNEKTVRRALHEAASGKTTWQRDRRRVEQTPARAAEVKAKRAKAHQYFSPLKAERAHAKTLPLPRNAGLSR